MIEKIGFILGKLWAFSTSRPQKWFILSGLLIASSVWIYKTTRSSTKPPDACDCTLNALIINTPTFDSLFQKKCEKYLAKLTKEGKQERVVKSFECPQVKSELEHQEKEKAKQEAERLFRQNCNSEAARNFVRNRFRDIGTAILEGPVLIDSNNNDCYYMYSVIARKGFEVVGCEMAVKFEGEKFEVKYVNCQ